VTPVDPFLQALEASTRLDADYSIGATLLALLLAFVLGQLVAWTYSWTHSGLSYSRSFTQSLVLMTIVVALVMFVIGNSIVTAFGLLGALALIRFRNVLKDTRDTVFVFMSLVVGMAVGTQRYAVAIVGTLMLLLVVLYLNATAFGSLGRYDGYLTVRVRSAAAGRRESSGVLDKFCRAIRPISTRQSGEDEGAEYVYQIGLRDRQRSDELLRELRGIDGVLHASLVLRSELSEV
jgi:uncharacterized membrane protein YhiD involved in acid resistance